MLLLMMECLLCLVCVSPFLLLFEVPLFIVYGDVFQSVLFLIFKTGGIIASFFYKELQL